MLEGMQEFSVLPAKLLKKIKRSQPGQTLDEPGQVCVVQGRRPLRERYLQPQLRPRFDEGKGRKPRPLGARGLGMFFRVAVGNVGGEDLQRRRPEFEVENTPATMAACDVGNLEDRAG
jgi:hypothetical protein